MDSPFSWEMLRSKQQLMKYLPLSCMCVQLGIPSRVTPAHPLMGTRMNIKPWVRPKMLWVSLHLGSEPTEKHKGALGVGALCCWMSHTVADIHIDEKKKNQSRSKFNSHVFVANGRKQGSPSETLVFLSPVAAAFWNEDILIPFFVWSTVIVSLVLVLIKPGFQKVEMLFKT